MTQHTRIINPIFNELKVLLRMTYKKPVRTSALETSYK